MTTPAAAPPATPQPLPSLESHNEKMRDEYETGLDKTGPQWERLDEENEGSEP